MIDETCSDCGRLFGYAGELDRCWERRASDVASNFSEPHDLEHYALAIRRLRLLVIAKETAIKRLALRLQLCEALVDRGAWFSDRHMQAAVEVVVDKLRCVLRGWKEIERS